MKKIFALALVFCVLLTMAACNAESGTSMQVPTESTKGPVIVSNPKPDVPAEEDDGLDPYVKMLMNDRFYSTGASNDDFSYNVFTWSGDSGYVIVKKYKGTEATVVIPDTLDGFPVIGIYHSMFDETGFVSDITFPDTMRTIVFNTRADSDVCMGGTVWYEQQPDGIYYAGKIAAGCKGNGEFTLREGTIGIGGAAFRGREDLKTIELPDSLLMIGDDAFAGSGLTEITIPATLQYYFGSFSSCHQLERVIFQEGITEITGTVSASGVREVVLPNSLEVIGEKAFMRCSNLQHITLPNNVVSIGEAAFYDSGLTGITLNEGLRVIGTEAFWGCKNLKSIYIPSSVTQLGMSALGSGLSDQAKSEFVVYFPASCAVMESLQSKGVNCQIGTAEDAKK